MIEITNSILISEDELSFVFSRSPGPGGQNVNKLNTRVTVLFDLGETSAFSDSQKNRIHKKLASRIDKLGRLQVTCSEHRSQIANRRAVIERLAQLLKAAIKRPPVRKKTKKSRSAIEKRLKLKKQKSDIKQQRRKNIPHE